MTVIFAQIGQGISTPATFLILIVTILISVQAFSNPSRKSKMMMSPYLVRTRRQYFRFLSSGFIHADVGHLFFNMFTFYMFGKIIEDFFIRKFGLTNFFLGSILFLGFYISAIIVSELVSFFKHRFNPNYASLGASGAVSAVVFMLILFQPMAGLGLMFIPIRIPAFIFGLLYLMYSAYMSKYGSDNIGHDAHLYGALYGILIGIVIEPRAVPYFIEQISNWKGFF